MKVKSVFLPQEYSIFYVVELPDNTQKMFWADPARKLTKKDLFPADGLFIDKKKGGHYLDKDHYGRYGLEMV